MLVAHLSQLISNMDLKWKPNLPSQPLPNRCKDSSCTPHGICRVYTAVIDYKATPAVPDPSYSPSPMDPSKIREKISRFRILVIGRANAGKTAILQRVCNTQENPEIYNCAGKQIDAAVLNVSRERGEHDIENEMVFQSNPGFVFHDSRGFEAGGESEFDKVKEFIAGRSKETRLKNQLHAIWYCIPMDEASRPFTESENNFFSESTGSITVIVLFTKFDALTTSNSHN
ncbi:hypothetical protein F4604DRAFT_757375 [Suillus subluteus]|nr:hypothetical protein F4604DRAFT_757375 [Suillus subluteus]